VSRYLNESTRAGPAGRRGTALAIVLLVAFTTLLQAVPDAIAQDLPDDARAVLREGQQKAAQAMTLYSDHYPDQPLWREAIELGRTAQRLAPDRTEPYRFLGQVYSVTGWYGRAWEAWRGYEQRGGEMDAQARTQLLAAATWLGFHGFASGEYGRALPYLTEALRLNPNDRLTLNRLVQSHLELGNAEAARPYAETLAALDEGSADLLERTEAYLEYGPEAVDAVREGEALYAQGRPADALERFRRAAESSPRYSAALRWAGRTALELDRPGEAARYWQRLVEIDPADQEAREILDLARNRERYGTPAFAAFQQGLTAYGEGNRARAVERFETAIRLSREFADAHAWLGRIAFEEGEFSAALERFRTAVAFAPGNTGYRFYLSAAEEQLRQETQERTLAAERERSEAEAKAQAEETRRVLEQARVQAEERARIEQEAREREAAAGAQQQQAAAPVARPEDSKQQGAQQQDAQQQDAPPQENVAAAPEPETPPAENPPRENQAENAPTAPPGQEAEPEVNVVAGVAPARPAGAGGPPLLLADVVMSHQSAEGGGTGAFSFLSNESLLRNFASPVDYAGGTLYQRLEVRSKPSDAPVHYQLCLVPNDSISVQPACSAGSLLVFDEEGVFEARQEMETLSGYRAIDWRNGLESVILVIKDPSGLPIDSRYLLGDGQTAPDPELYYPLEVRFTAIVVPPGAQFPGWPQ
jgi:tetratricopeptide (TPR) repeat protein